MTRALFLGLGLLLLGGCATFTASEQRSLDEVRRLADRTARAYSRPPVQVVVSREYDAPPGAYRRGAFSLNARALTSPFRDAIVAHELGHYVLGHEEPLHGSTDAEIERDYQQRELDANAEAVEILRRIAGMSEVRAFKAMYDYLLGVQMAREQFSQFDLHGHKPPCEEIADLLTRFPTQRAWTESLECAPVADDVTG